MTELNVFFGLGIFLLGMSQLEYGIRKLSDVRLRYWVRSSTGTPASSVATGIISTAILQSSSMVSLLVLAFASAGLVPLVNGIGIILGANLGTTFTGWLVAIFGFKIDLESIALPLLGTAGVVMAMSRRDSRLNYSATIAFGIALVLFGLGIMKSSMESLPQQWDISALKGHHAVIYLAAGIVFTIVMQSSSAVMMIALAAINAEFIALPEAVALIIGADLGTTSTTALGSITGNQIKKRLAFAHFSFNLIVDMAAFLLLLPLLPQLFSLFSLNDPLYSLVAFHSLMNVLGLIAFLPFINYFANWIEKLFSRSLSPSQNLLVTVTPNVVDAALVALSETVKLAILQAACNNLRVFSLKPEQLKIITESGDGVIGAIGHHSFEEGYEELKTQEGRILDYLLQIQTQALNMDESKELERWQAVTRHVVFSSKCLKDIQHDLHELKYSTSKAMRELYDSQKQFQKTVYEKMIGLLVGDHPEAFVLEELHELRVLTEQHKEESTDFVYSHAGRDYRNGTGVSIQLNTIREIRNAAKTLTKAIHLATKSEQNDVLLEPVLKP